MTSRLDIAIVLGVLAGCVGPSDGAGGDQRAWVVAYSAQDREFGEPVLRAYAQRTGVEVLTKFDVESSKAVGLANAIIAETARPRCDLFWNTRRRRDAGHPAGRGQRSPLGQGDQARGRHDPPRERPAGRIGPEIHRVTGSESSQNIYSYIIFIYL
jgi:hypothetical protein